MQNDIQGDDGDVLWLGHAQYVSIAELINLSGASESGILELIDAGVLAPAGAHERSWMFRADCVLQVRRAVRLRDELELDTHALALALALLARIEMLEMEVARLVAQRPRFIRH